MVSTTILVAISLLQLPEMRFEPVHDSTSFKEPVQVLFDGVQNETMYVLEKNGKVRRASLDSVTTTNEVFMDITDRVDVGNPEEGLLSLAFHPKFKDNGQVVVWYTAHRPRRAILSRFTRDPETNNINSASEEILLEVNQPWANHNGGTVLFDNSGRLFVSIGDGGSGNDPRGHGQNINTLLATIIRIDIDNPSGDKKYSIPATNPFVDNEFARGEIWAHGLRNVWRMSFDRKTGSLWAADVGQNKWEEIDIITCGGNYGWNLREGKHPFIKNAEVPNLIDPVQEYGRSLGGSITGGYVYRGKEIPELDGHYIYADYMSRNVWALSRPTDSETNTVSRITRDTPLAISSFGETPSGEILVCGFMSPYTKKGKIYRLVLSPSITSDIR